MKKKRKLWWVIIIYLSLFRLETDWQNPNIVSVSTQILCDWDVLCVMCAWIYFDNKNRYHFTMRLVKYIKNRYFCVSIPTKQQKKNSNFNLKISINFPCHFIFQPSTDQLPFLLQARSGGMNCTHIYIVCKRKMVWIAKCGMRRISMCEYCECCES